MLVGLGHFFTMGFGWCWGGNLLPKSVFFPKGTAHPLQNQHVVGLIQKDPLQNSADIRIPDAGNLPSVL